MAKRLFLALLIVLLVMLVAVRITGGQPGTGGESTMPAFLEQLLPTPTPPIDLKAVMTAEELAALNTEQLVTLDLTGSTCYEAIESFRAAHPTVLLTYAVMLDGNGETMALAPDTETLALSDGRYLDALAANAPWLPRLSAITLSEGIASAEQMLALDTAYPEATIEYPVTVNGTVYNYDLEELDLSALTADEIVAVLPELSQLPLLKQVNLVNADGESRLTMDEAAQLAQQYPQVALTYAFELFGKTVSTGDERLEYANMQIGDAGLNRFREILPFMYNLKALVLDDCGTTDSAMAQLRDEFPDKKIIWRIHFGKFNCLTDTEMIWATGTVTDGVSGPLKYCTDVKYIDMGHNCITNIDFVRYMPKLEVAIFSVTWVRDLSPFANCPNLRFLEIFNAEYPSVAPLANCTKLEHLNISYNRGGMNDISPLYELPNLKRFWCTMSNISTDQQQEIQSRMPNCQFEFRWIDPAEGNGNWRLDENGEPNEYYAEIRRIFDYDSMMQTGAAWSLYG